MALTDISPLGNAMMQQPQQQTADSGMSVPLMSLLANQQGNAGGQSPFAQVLHGLGSSVAGQQWGGQVPPQFMQQVAGG